jgi:hypothetical protein
VSWGSVQPFYRHAGGGGAGRGQAEGGAFGTRAGHRRRVIAWLSGIDGRVAHARWAWVDLGQGRGDLALGWSGPIRALSFGGLRPGGITS